MIDLTKVVKDLPLHGEQLPVKIPQQQLGADSNEFL